MGLFRRKEKKQNGQDWVAREALNEALRELEEERNEKIKYQLELKEVRNNQYDMVKKVLNYDILENNLKILQNTIENIKDICKKSKTSTIAKAILKELGE